MRMIEHVLVRLLAMASRVLLHLQQQRRELEVSCNAEAWHALPQAGC